MIRLRPRLLPVAFALISSLPAQDDKPAGQGQMSDEERAKLEKIEKMQGLKDGKGLNPKVDAESAGKELGPDGKPVLPHNAGPRGFCRFDAVIAPKRLLPGQSGTALVTMILEGDAVLPASAPITLKASTGQMQVGALSVRPAARATVAKAFAGQPAYDNWAVMELPVTMPPTAALGSKQMLALDFEFDLVSGSKAEPLGHFSDRVTVVCEVGAAPNPLVQSAPAAATGPGAAAGGGEAAPPPEPTTPATGPAKAATDQRPVVSGQAQPVAATPRGSESTGDAPEFGDSRPSLNGGPDMLLVGGGAAFVLLLVVGGYAVMRRR